MGTMDSSSISATSGVTYTFPSQTGYFGGLFFEDMLNSWFGFRAGLQTGQVSSGYSINASGSTGTGVQTISATMVPVLAEIQVASFLKVLAGGFYWTANSVTCTYTGVSVGSSCFLGQGSGFGARGGLGFNFGTNFEIDALYEPSVQVAPATSSNTNKTTVTSIAAEVVWKF